MGSQDPRAGPGPESRLGRHLRCDQPGEVRFEDVGGGQTSVRLFLEYEPEGLVEKVGDKLGIVEKQAQGDLDRFKAFIESEGYASGAWRGAVNPETNVGAPGVEHAVASRGDDGKAGLSGKAVAAGVGLAAAGVAAAMRSKSDSGDEVTPVADLPVATTPPAAPLPTTPPPAAPSHAESTDRRPEPPEHTPGAVRP